MTQESLFLNRRLIPASVGNNKTAADPRFDRFERLVRQYDPIVYAVCRMLAASESEASLCCEDAFVEVYQQPHFLTTDPAHFLCETMRAALERVNAVSSGRSMLGAPGIDAQWAALAMEDRNIVALRFAGRLEIAEISEVLCLPKAAVRDRLWRAMRHFGGRLMGKN